VVPILFTLVIIVGFIGNLLVVLVVLVNRNMRNTTNILILNLAVSAFKGIVSGDWGELQMVPLDRYEVFRITFTFKLTDIFLYICLKWCPSGCASALDFSQEEDFASEDVRFVKQLNRLGAGVGTGCLLPPLPPRNGECIQSAAFGDFLFALLWQVSVVIFVLMSVFFSFFYLCAKVHSGRLQRVGIEIHTFIDHPRPPPPPPHI
jgi:hypothetical protein